MYNVVAATSRRECFTVDFHSLQFSKSLHPLLELSLSLRDVAVILKIFNLELSITHAQLSLQAFQSEVPILFANYFYD